MHGMAWYGMARRGRVPRGIIIKPLHASPLCESCPRGPFQPAAGLAANRWTITVRCVCGVVIVATAKQLYVPLSAAAYVVAASCVAEYHDTWPTDDRLGASLLGLGLG